MEQAFDYLDAPVIRVLRQGRADALCRHLEKLALPNVDEVIAAVNAVTYRLVRRTGCRSYHHAGALSDDGRGQACQMARQGGDSVSSGDVICEIETDKATMEVEAVDEGKIGKILVAEGTEGVKVNAVIAVLLQDGESADAAPAPKAEAPKAAPAAEAPKADAGTIERADAATQTAPTATADTTAIAAPVHRLPSLGCSARSGQVPRAARPCLAAGTSPRQGGRLRGLGHFWHRAKGRVVKSDVEAAKSASRRSRPQALPHWLQLLAALRRPA